MANGRTGFLHQVNILVRLATPVVIARSGALLMGMVDAIMVGRYAADELAYLGIALAPMTTLLVAGIGLMMGTMVVTATAHGAGRLGECGMIWRHALRFGLVVGTVAALVCLPGETILTWFGQSPDIAHKGGAVLRVLALSIPSYLIFVATIYFLEAIRKPYPGMIAMILANLLNAGVNAVLIYGLVGIPAMGALGSAWSTTIVRAIAALGLAAYVWWLPERDSLGIRRPLTGGWQAWAEQRRIGYGAGASVGIETAAFNVLAVFSGWLGALPLAAYTIALNLIALVFMIAVGIGAATSVEVGAARGREDPSGQRRAGWSGLGLNTLAMASLAVLFCSAPNLLASSYSADPALIGMAAPLVAFSALILIVDGGQAVMAGALRGLGETWGPTILHTISYLVIMVPVTWWLAFALGRTITGIFEGMFIGSVVSVVLLCARFAWLTRGSTTRDLPVQPSER